MGYVSHNQMVFLPGMIETSDQWSVQFTDHGSAEKTTLKLTEGSSEGSSMLHSKPWLFFCTWKQFHQNDSIVEMLQYIIYPTYPRVQPHSGTHVFSSPRNQTPRIRRMFSALLLCWFQLLVVSNQILMVQVKVSRNFISMTWLQKTLPNLWRKSKYFS